MNRSSVLHFLESKGIAFLYFLFALLNITLLVDLILRSPARAPLMGRVSLYTVLSAL